MGPPLDTRLVDLVFGWPSESKVDRNTAAFYRVTIEDKHNASGFFFYFRSSNKGKFRVIVLDKEGNGTFINLPDPDF